MMKKVLWIFLALVGSVAAAAAENGGKASEADLIAVGSRIYREGILISGQPLTGELPGDIKMADTQAACVKCHKRSGFGSSEGGKAVPPLTRNELYQPMAARGIKLYGAQNRPKSAVRPAYTDESLAKALREGVDPMGRRLLAPMPRFALGDNDMAALVAYLKTLSADSVPGVDDKTLHLATIVTDDVSPERRNYLLDVLQAFIHDWNADIRHQTGRATFALDKMYEAYRHWDLHVWELKGPRGTWPSQLEKYYRDQPVFAVLSGISSGSWQPVHLFCEQTQLPCLYPITDQPVVAEKDFYSMYFSKGVVTEAEVLAKHLHDDNLADSTAVVQVFRSDESGVAASTAFRNAMTSQGYRNVKDRGLKAGDKIPPAFWSGLMEQDQPSVLVLWLKPEDMASIGSRFQSNNALKKVYVSESLHGSQDSALGKTMKEKLFVLYPFDLPDSRSKRLARMKAWLAMKKIPIVNDLDQGRAYFAMLSISESIKHLQGNYSKELLVERLENMASTAIPSPFPRLSLAAGQRYASKGGYVVQQQPSGKLKAVSDWIVP